jgi:transketolase
VESKELALKIRQHVIQMTHDAKCSHIGSCLSCADILAVLYNIKDKEDKFILSKGHASAALYAVLAESGYFPIEYLKRYYHDTLCGHASHYVPGVDVSTGALGHGLSIGCGMALSTKNKVYVLLGDGDLNEGSTWEAAIFASHHRLNNLVAIVDYNKLQALGNIEDILDLTSLTGKMLSFGWDVREVNGHDTEEMANAFATVKKNKYQPSCFIAYTIKGKGVSFCENKVEWHYKHPNDEELKKALEELK